MTAAAPATRPASPPTAGTLSAPRAAGARDALVYVLLGAVFGVVLVKSEAASWYRIQEMIRFQSPHLFAVLGSAVLTAGVGLRWMRRRGVRTRGGAPIVLPPKEWGTGVRYAVGGTIFGLGWTLTGACPGPFYALLGAGVWTMLLPLLGAVAGAWVYGWARPRLPH